MLRPEQVANVQFNSVGRGAYKAEDVDAYVRAVSESYTQMFKENGDLVRKIAVLADKVEEYRRDEDSIKTTLLTAQRMADKITKEANENVDAITAQAKAEAQQILDNANAEAASAVEEAKITAKDLVANSKAAVESLTEKAKQDSEAAVTAANAKADELIAAAEEKAAQIIGDSEVRLAAVTAEYQRISALSDEFKANILNLYYDQISAIKETPVAESVVEEQTVAPELIEEDDVIGETPVYDDVVVEEIQAEEIAEEETESVEVDEDVAEETETFEDDTVVAEPEAVSQGEVTDLFDNIAEEIFAAPVASEEPEYEEVVEEIVEDDDLTVFDAPVAYEPAPAFEETVIEEPVESASEDIPVFKSMASAQPDAEEEFDEFDGFKFDLDDIDSDNADSDSDDPDDFQSFFSSFFDEN